eukprot:3938613-Rhodomonas_salina.1
MLVSEPDVREWCCPGLRPGRGPASMSSTASTSKCSPSSRSRYQHPRKEVEINDENPRFSAEIVVYCL